MDDYDLIPARGWHVNEFHFGTMRSPWNPIEGPQVVLVSGLRTPRPNEGYRRFFDSDDGQWKYIKEDLPHGRGPFRWNHHLDSWSSLNRDIPYHQRWVDGRDNNLIGEEEKRNVYATYITRLYSLVKAYNNRINCGMSRKRQAES
jgi:hypothetical protein